MVISGVLIGVLAFVSSILIILFTFQKRKKNDSRIEQNKSEIFVFENEMNSIITKEKFQEQIILII